MVKKTLKTSLILFIVVMVVYFSYQLYSMFRPVFKTETAQLQVVADSVNCVGIAVREEQLIIDTTSGLRNYLVSDGQKVPANSAIAEIYVNPETARNKLLYNGLLGEQKTFLDASSVSSVSGVNIFSVSGSIENKLVDLAGTVTGNSVSFEHISMEQELFSLLNIFSAASGTRFDFSGKMNSLNASIDIFDTNFDPSGYVYTQDGGYFVSSTDGYEPIINPEILFTLTPGQLDKIIKDPVPESSINDCKVISDFTWYFAALVSEKEVTRFKADMDLLLDFKYSFVQSLPVKVVEVITGDGKAIIIFKADRLNPDIVDLRVEEAAISFRNYSGIRIDRSWLRMENGVLGVYTHYGTTVVFKSINIIYENENYVIASVGNTGKNTLQLYDEIITEGKDLYNGKEIG